MKTRRLPGGARPVLADQVVQRAMSLTGNFAHFFTGGPGALKLGNNAIQRRLNLPTHVPALVGQIQIADHAAQGGAQQRRQQYS